MNRTGHHRRRSSTCGVEADLRPATLDLKSKSCREESAKPVIFSPRRALSLTPPPVHAGRQLSQPQTLLERDLFRLKEEFSQKVNEEVSKRLSTLPPPLEASKRLIFLSHAKAEAGVSARSLKTELFNHLNKKYKGFFDKEDIFLDSDNLNDLSSLTEEVKQSENFLLCLTKGVLTRPWVLLEIIAAVESNRNIILAELESPTDGFNYDLVPEYIHNFVCVKGVTAECLATLKQNGCDAESVQRALAKLFSKIARPLNFLSASRRVLDAQILDVIDQLQIPVGTPVVTQDDAFPTMNDQSHQTTISASAAAKAYKRYQPQRDFKKQHTVHVMEDGDVPRPRTIPISPFPLLSKRLSIVESQPTTQITMKSAALSKNNNFDWGEIFKGILFFIVAMLALKEFLDQICELYGTDEFYE